MKEFIKSEHITSLIIFWCCILLLGLGFYINSYWSCLLFVFILPVMFGTHEAIHENIIPNREGNILKKIHNDIALLIGCSVQIMNFKLLRQAHLKHHALGRYGEGYSPDIIPGKRRVIDYLIYYSYLTFIPAILYQVTGFILVLIPVKYLPFDYKLDLHQDRSPIPYWLIQLFCLISLFSFIYFGGIYKFLVFESFFVFIWCILQNSAHYGLKGINSKTDRVCAYTYILEKPFKLLTFGSTSHLAHHVDMEIPCLDLYNPDVLKRIEQKIGVEINVKYGIISFIGDIIEQFKGPINIDQLNTRWMKSGNLGYQDTSNVEFFYRKGIKRKTKI